MTNMSLIREFGLGIALASLACAATTSDQITEQKSLVERVEETAPVKPISVMDAIRKPFSNTPVFRNDNYLKEPVNPEDWKAQYWIAYDVEPIKAADFSAPSKDGKMVSLQELAKRTDFVLIEFTGRNCGPCRALAPRLNKFYTQNKDRLELVSIVLSPGKEEWEKYAAEIPSNHPLVADFGGKIIDQYGFNYVPAFALAQKFKENNKDVLKVISVCNGGVYHALRWLENIAVQVEWAQIIKESSKKQNSAK